MIINHFYRSADAVIPISFVMRTLPRTLFVALLSLQKIKILRQIFYVRKNHSNQKTLGKKERGQNMLPKRMKQSIFFRRNTSNSILLFQKPWNCDRELAQTLLNNSSLVDHILANIGLVYFRSKRGGPQRYMFNQNNVVGPLGELGLKSKIELIDTLHKHLVGLQ